MRRSITQPEDRTTLIDYHPSSSLHIHQRDHFSEQPTGTTHETDCWTNKTRCSECSDKFPHLNAIVKLEVQQRRGLMVCPSSLPWYTSTAMASEIASTNEDLPFCILTLLSLQRHFAKS
uniref:Uncharacterized protein n=1 Tax=Echinococcus granulosus TaxID=6210 RepID=U6JIP3_ECHGR|nr:hypothetical protein EgrG_002047000 [Echinococcus granulosus]CDS23957.1 hypothetical protein EgrG_002047300 [Echinococcus granulosus]